MTSVIAQILVTQGKKLFDMERVAVSFTGIPEANALLNDLERQPHAFVLACLADRQIKAERAWIVPYELSRRLGGISFDLLRDQSEDKIVRAFLQPTPLHRYAEAIGRDTYLAIKRIEDIYQGNAAQIWQGEPSSAEVVLRFLQFQGIGPKIATMAANILARDFKIRFSDYCSIDISVDVHIRRVFQRLGLIQEGASVEEVIYRARSLHPEFPGLMDLPCWHVGRNWCHARMPECATCYMSIVCPEAKKGDFRI